MSLQVKKCSLEQTGNILGCRIDDGYMRRDAGWHRVFWIEDKDKVSGFGDAG